MELRIKMGISPKSRMITFVLLLLLVVTCSKFQGKSARLIRAIDIKSFKQDNGGVIFQVNTNVERFRAKRKSGKNSAAVTNTPTLPSINDKSGNTDDQNNNEDSVSITDGGGVMVDVFSTLHIGTKEYYNSLERYLQDYDYVLYELITSRNNIAYDAAVDYKKRLKTEVYAPQAARLSKQLQLTDQLQLPLLTGTNWYIADVESEIIQKQESQNQWKTYFTYLSSIFGGRSFSKQFLQGFFVSDTGLLSILRFFAWFTPCPELNCLLIDWSRMSPKAGGLSPYLLPIFRLFLQGQFLEARRLLFAQQLLAGLPDWGSWGGEAKSDIETRIISRNQECCRVLAGFLEECRTSSQNVSTATEETPSKKIAVLYGSYHIEDLCYRLETTLGLQRYNGPQEKNNNSSAVVARSNKSGKGLKSFTAWSIVVPPTSSELTSNLLSQDDNDDSLSMSSSSESNANNDNDGAMDIWSVLSSITNSKNKALFIPLILLVPSYLLLGAIDWWVLIKLLTQDIRIDVLTSLLHNTANAYLPFTNDNYGTLEGRITMFSLLQQQQGEWLLWTIGYVILYIQRHLFILRSVSSIGIQWDKGMFADILVKDNSKKQ